MNGIEKITARIETDMKAEIEALLKEGEAKAKKKFLPRMGGKRS